MVKDPVCGMNVSIREAGKKSLVLEKEGKKYYFCSEKCKTDYVGGVPWYRTEGFGKVFPFVLAFVLIAGTGLSIVFGFMLLYMGLFFILFSFMKMLDWKGFVEAFGTYDLAAGRSKLYAWVYPALEFALGLIFLVSYFIGAFYLAVAAWVTLVIMVIGGIGVGKKLLKKEKFKCACLGTFINVPLTKVTLLEDILMAFMAVILIIKNQLIIS